MGFIKVMLVIIGILCVFSLVSAFVLIPMEENSKLKNFCNENGYSNYEKSFFRWEKDYCAKMDGKNSLIKVEVDKCNEKGMTLYDLCFVKT